MPTRPALVLAGAAAIIVAIGCSSTAKPSAPAPVTQTPARQTQQPAPALPTTPTDSADAPAGGGGRGGRGGGGGAQGAATNPLPYARVVTAQAQTRAGLFKVHRIGERLLFEIPRTRAEQGHPARPGDRADDARRRLRRSGVRQPRAAIGARDNRVLLRGISIRGHRERHDVARRRRGCRRRTSIRSSRCSTSRRMGPTARRSSTCRGCSRSRRSSSRRRSASRRSSARRDAVFDRARRAFPDNVNV